MTGVFRAACVQLRSGLDVAANVAAATKLIRDAKVAGAAFVGELVWMIVIPIAVGIVLIVFWWKRSL